jgi:hypothetical protein
MAATSRSIHKPAKKGSRSASAFRSAAKKVSIARKTVKVFKSKAKPK